MFIVLYTCAPSLIPDVFITSRFGSSFFPSFCLPHSFCLHRDYSRSPSLGGFSLLHLSIDFVFFSFPAICTPVAVSPCWAMQCISFHLLINMREKGTLGAFQSAVDSSIVLNDIFRQLAKIYIWGRSYGWSTRSLGRSEAHFQFPQTRSMPP